MARAIIRLIHDALSKAGLPESRRDGQGRAAPTIGYLIVEPASGPVEVHWLERGGGVRSRLGRGVYLPRVLLALGAAGLAVDYGPERQFVVCRGLQARQSERLGAVTIPEDEAGDCSRAQQKPDDQEKER